MSNIVIDLGNSELINSLSNISQFINLWQSSKSATYSQLANETIKQNQKIENVIDNKNNELLGRLIEELYKIQKQNEEIIMLLKER